MRSTDPDEDAEDILREFLVDKAVDDDVIDPAGIDVAYEHGQWWIVVRYPDDAELLGATSFAVVDVVKPNGDECLGFEPL